MGRKIFNNLIFFNLKKLHLEDRLAVIFLITGMILSAVGIVTSFIFGDPFWINLPNILAFLICISVPFIFKEKLLDIVLVVLFFIGFIYFPFIFFTNGGLSGSGIFYFAMIVVYFTFYLRGKRLYIVVGSIMLYYIVIFLIGYYKPEFIIPYRDEATHLIDVIVAFISVSIVFVIIGSTTFASYKKERNNSLQLMKELELKNANLERLSIHDQLTELYNRRFLFESLEVELDDYKVNGEDFYLMMLDLDHFKNVNDKYGHVFGDDVLRKVARSIRGCVRDHDIVARYGGEEFSILVTNAKEIKGYELAERIRKSVSELDFRYDVKVTVSIGIAKNIFGDGPLDIVRRADGKLYQAKDNGRNQTVE